MRFFYSDGLENIEKKLRCFLNLSAVGPDSVRTSVSAQVKLPRIADFDQLIHHLRACMQKLSKNVSVISQCYKATMIEFKFIGHIKLHNMCASCNCAIFTSLLSLSRQSCIIDGHTHFYSSSAAARQHHNPTTLSLFSDSVLESSNVPVFHSDPWLNWSTSNLCITTIDGHRKCQFDSTSWPSGRLSNV